jgi:ribosomal protein S18 acetylase RimI-like enzyme
MTARRPQSESVRRACCGTANRSPAPATSVSSKLLVKIRRLTPTDAIAYRRLRLRGLRQSPLAFGSSYAEEAKYPLAVFETRLQPSASKWAFGAFAGEQLVGVVTLIRDGKPKTKHNASIYGMYVERKMRRNGLGRRLLHRAIETARRMRGLRQVRLAVVEGNRPALHLYERAGFKVYGREEAALRVAGKYYAELFLALRL